MPVHLHLRHAAAVRSPLLQGMAQSMSQSGAYRLTLVHARAQLEQLQDTFMSQVGLHGGQKSSS